MSLDAAAILAQLAKKSVVVPRIGRYVGAQAGQALIDMGDQRFPAAFATAFVPQINEPVHVWSIDGAMFMVGPSTPKPGVGIIATITGTHATVTTDFGDFEMTVAPTDPMPTSGDSVGISWSTMPWCTLLVDVPDAPPPPPAPGGGGSTQTAEFRAIAAGSTDRHQSRWWTAQPWASANTYGAWIAGTAIRDTIPAGAELVYEHGVPQLQVYVSWAVRRYGPPRWVMHNLFAMNAVPGVSAYHEWEPAGQGWQTPPMAQEWFDGLKAGGGWAGIGFNQGGYEQAKSLAQDGMSGALRIKWKA